MKSRIYILAVLFFALIMLATAPVKADNRRNSDNHSNNHDNDRDKDKKGNGHSDRNLPINTAIVALLVAGVGIGVIAIKRASSAAKAI